MAEMQPGTTNSNALVMESDLTYEGPDNTPDYSLKDIESKFIDDLMNGGVQDEGNEFTPESEPAEEPAEVEEPVETEEPTDPEQEEEPADPKLERGIQRVVAREMAARAEREAADKSIAELKSLRDEMAKYKDLKSAAELSNLMDLDPIGAFKAMGKDPETMIKLALAQQLGDSAPQHLKDFAKDASTKREIAALRAQISQQNQAQAAAAYFNTVQSGAREYVLGFDKETKPGKKVGDSTPTLALVAKADPDYARDSLMEEIVAEAQRKAAQDPNGEPISYAEAASRVETRLAKLAKLLVPNGTKTANKTVSKPGIPPTIKPANKPIVPPWKRDASSIEEQGLAEALRVYEREEAARKARR